MNQVAGYTKGGNSNFSNPIYAPKHWQLGCKNHYVNIYMSTENRSSPTSALTANDRCKPCANDRQLFCPVWRAVAAHSWVWVVILRLRHKVGLRTSSSVSV